MGKNATIIGASAVIAIIFLGAWWVLSQNATAPTNQIEKSNSEERQTPAANDNGSAPKTYEIVYGDSGYSPSALTVKAGDTVLFKNNSSKGMWPASAMHPTHMVYGGTSLQQHCPDAENDDFDACQSIAIGQSWSFTFAKVGAWGFHDHITANNFGKITIE